MESIENTNQLKSVLELNQLLKQYYESKNLVDECKALYEASNAEKDVFYRFLDEVGFNFFSDGLWDRVSLGKNAERLKPYFEKGVLFETYRSEMEDLYELALWKYLALSTDQELIEMEFLGILVPGVSFSEVVTFLRMKDEENKLKAA